jgi:hypothetical protein
MSTYVDLYPPSNCYKNPKFISSKRIVEYSADLIRKLRVETKIVTAASSQNYVELNRFLDSINRWEPAMNTIVYDLGLTRQQLDEIAQREQVKVIPLKYLVDKPWAHLVDFLKQFHNNAWRPLVIEVPVYS